jgi:amidophosphoribosyltransferase
MAKIFDVDSLGFLPLEAVTKLGDGGSCNGYCTACFDGKYPTEIPEITTNKFDYKISENK